MPNRTDLTGAAVTAVANVAIPVADHDRAIAFYVGNLGLDVRRDATFGVDTGVRLSVADAGATHAALSAASTWTAR
jgi:catechol 2,3-dioxygenase-like lactoylglutathione lyase family enzyme